MPQRIPRPASAPRAQSRVQPSAPSATVQEADRALANIRAWSDMLVARGNRLLELAARERQTVDGVASYSSRRHRDAGAAGAKPLA